MRSRGDGAKFAAPIAHEDYVAAIRVMLGELPSMIHGILEHTLAVQDDMQLVGTTRDSASLADQVAASRPDVLIVGVDRPDWATRYIELFVRHAQLHVLAIGGDARSATVQELFVRQQRIPELSPDVIVAAVRASRDSGHADTVRALGGRG